MEPRACDGIDPTEKVPKNGTGHCVGGEKADMGAEEVAGNAGRVAPGQYEAGNPGVKALAEEEGGKAGNV
jgi:hypothetical protein